MQIYKKKIKKINFEKSMIGETSLESVKICLFVPKSKARRNKRIAPSTLRDAVSIPVEKSKFFF